MFIPTLYTGKGKPFAFLPETISPGPWDIYSGLYETRPHLIPPPPDPYEMYMSCYWQEIKAGKTLACYGSITVCLDKKFFPDGIDNPDFSFDTFLEFAGHDPKVPDHEFKMPVMSINSVNAIHKLGRSNPWKTWHEPRTPYFDEIAAYDPQILANMVTNPSQVPAGAVGWFKLATNKKR